MKISELPKKLKEKAENNRTVVSKTDDLSAAFVWDNTPEGHRFWYKLHYSASIIEAKREMSKEEKSILNNILK